MKNIYDIIEMEYKKSKNKKNFSKTKFNFYIENLIKKKYKDCNSFYVVQDTLASPSGTYPLNSQAFQKCDEMYETTFGLMLFIDDKKTNKLVIHKGFLTCEDLELNLNLKNKEKNNIKIF